MKIVCFFNNKGGVGKTTLVCNIASSVAQHHKRRVLVLDADPQCNSTLLVLGEDRAVSLYWPEVRSDAPPSSEFGAGHKSVRPTTLWDVLEPIDLGETSIGSEINPASGSHNRFGFDLLPGHPRSAMVEDRLAQAWRDSLGGDFGGLRKTNWLTQLRRALEDKYDILFVDLGPSLGALNRSALLGADYFVAPMGADVFSVIGLRNISEWLSLAIDDYRQSVKLCGQRNRVHLDSPLISQDPMIGRGFAGYTIQSYIAKYKAGERRPTFAYEQIISSFPGQVREYLEKFTDSASEPDQFKLGEIPNMYSLVPLAQSANAPISELKAADGLVGSHYTQSKRYGSIVSGIVERLFVNIGEAAA